MRRENPALARRPVPRAGEKRRAYPTSECSRRTMSAHIVGAHCRRTLSAHIVGAHCRRTLSPHTWTAYPAGEPDSVPRLTYQLWTSSGQKITWLNSSPIPVSSRRALPRLGHFMTSVTTQPQLIRKPERGERKRFSLTADHCSCAVGRKRPPLCRGCAPATPPYKNMPHRPCAFFATCRLASMAAVVHQLRHQDPEWLQG